MRSQNIAHAGGKRRELSKPPWAWSFRVSQLCADRWGGRLAPSNTVGRKPDRQLLGKALIELFCPGKLVEKKHRKFESRVSRETWKRHRRVSTSFMKRKSFCKFPFCFLSSSIQLLGTCFRLREIGITLPVFLVKSTSPFPGNFPNLKKYPFRRIRWRSQSFCRL